MNKRILGLEEVVGSLVVYKKTEDVFFEEVVEIELNDGSVRKGRVIELDETKVVVQVFEGTIGISKQNTKTKFLNEPLKLGLSKEMLGRVFNGSGKVIDNLGPMFAEVSKDINGNAINPVSRTYPKNYILTGVSGIDGLNTLIRGQKLPIFSGSGLPHDRLAAQIVKQAKITGADEDNFVIVFGAMGITHDTADYFKETFKESGVSSKVVMFLNLSNDPVIERIITPRCALTTAEYLAYEKDMHVLVILTDMTSYCEALREFSSSKGEIPGRKGYPGYLYSDLASLYERAGIVENSKGSVTQIPILTMPNDDITSPVPDLTGYITEGQIVLDRNLHLNGIYPPIASLQSLSRLMKDGIGEGYTRSDHKDVANQLFASYAKVIEARALASVIGEDELNENDQKYIKFGKLFEKIFIGQGFNLSRNIEETLDLGWSLISILPKETLDRLDEKLINKYYDPNKAIAIIKASGLVDLDE